MLAAVAYAAVTASAEPAAVPPAPGVNAYGQPIGPAVLTSPPSHGGKVVTVALVGVTGIAASMTATRGGDANDHLGAVSLDTRRLGYVYDRGLVVRVSNTGGIGGNDRGVHGGLGGEVAGGYRFAVTETQGPFVRAGGEALVRGDALVYESLLEIPQLHVGYQYLSNETLLEITGRGGFDELGRSDTGYHATRHLDTTGDAGAMATIHTPEVLFMAEWSHFLPHTAGGAIDWLDVDLCSTHKWFAVCTDFKLAAGDVDLPRGGVASSRVTQIGLTIGRAGK